MTPLGATLLPAPRTGKHMAQWLRDSLVQRYPLVQVQVTGQFQ